MKWFMHRIKRTGETFDKGIEVHDSLASAKGAYFAYLGAYVYGRAQDTNVNFVFCAVTDMNGTVLYAETWAKETEEVEE